jgi:hypothetical protein
MVVGYDAREVAIVDGPGGDRLTRDAFGDGNHGTFGNIGRRSGSSVDSERSSASGQESRGGEGEANHDDVLTLLLALRKEGVKTVRRDSHGGLYRQTVPVTAKNFKDCF